MTEILVALITGGLALVGVILTNGKSARDMDAKLDKELDVMRTELKNLAGEVRKHNSLVERTYELEKRTEVQEEEIRVANHRIADLEAGR